ncbi:glycosyl hydrolase family 8 [Roseomonas marmotae]|uniref:glycosyl hydrolase family 8 n=1 Tax=Roseomonas marmotae TaxID=2768161 RepID=UPI001F00F6C7|nr:glycosyl hydrolase family 8 [Roseomonas marmotae]
MAGLTAAAVWSTARTPGHAELPSTNVATVGRGPCLGEWIAFRERFVAANGRVVDTGNGGISHSEGQGWAMLMAEAHDDRATFDRLLTWTQRNLRRSGDSLYAWRWVPNRVIAVEDTNNASDGDLFIAWALARAARRWQRPELRQLSSAICADLARLCVRQVDGRTLLLPASFGFEHRDAVVVNPSYYVFPALADLAGTARSGGPWMNLYEDGLTLLRDARFGRWGLPADWLRLSRHGGPPSPAPGWAPRFSYDAMRVPLFLAWGGLSLEPAARAAVDFWTTPAHPYQPAWTEFLGDRPAPYPLGTAHRAIARLAAATTPGPVALPGVAEAQDYYAAALTVLSHIALEERLPLTS